MSTVKVVHIKLYFWMINQFHKESDDCCCQKLSLKGEIGFVGYLRVSIMIYIGESRKLMKLKCTK